jgi:hypothetical protein
VYNEWLITVIMKSVPRWTKAHRWDYTDLRSEYNLFSAE